MNSQEKLPHAPEGDLRTDPPSGSAATEAGAGVSSKLPRESSGIHSEAALWRAQRHAASLDY